MPKRSAVEQLPPAVKQWLDRALVEGNFSGYELLEEELAKRNCRISKSAIHRYGQRFEERVAALKIATEQAKAVAEASPDNEGAMNDALIRLVQQKAFDVLMNLSEEDQPSIKDLSIAVERVGRASVSQKKWAAEVREKIALKMTALEKEAASKTPKGKARLDPETLRRIREEIYGIV